MTAHALPRAALRQWLPAAAVATILIVLIWATSGGLAIEARAALIAFALAIAAWTLSPLDDLVVAGLAVALLLLAGATGPEEVARLARHELIWLLVAAYVIAAAIRRTSLMDRLAIAVARGSRSLEALFYRLAALVAATAFVVPTTSGRAALLLPIFFGFSDALRDAQTTRALSLMFPSVILLSAGGVLTGAGAHLIALDILSASEETARVGYLAWTVLMLPIALVSSFAATGMIVRMFLSPEQRRRQPVLPAGPAGASGGIGATLAGICGARLHPRLDIVRQVFDFDARLGEADLVITAEGALDWQTPLGKIPAEIGRRAKALGIPVILAGAAPAGAELNHDHGITAFRSIVREPCSRAASMENAAALLEAAAEQTVRTFMAGLKVGRSPAMAKAAPRGSALEKLKADALAGP